MANSDKNIVITPNNGSATLQPNIVFTGQNNVPITLSVTDAGNITLTSSSGNLLTVANDSTGTVFRVSNSSNTAILTVTDTPAIITNAPITGDAGATLLDVHGQVDSINCVFTLRQNQTALSSTYIKDSKDLEVTVDGMRFEPFTSQQAFTFMPVYETNSKTFRVRQNRLIIYNAPEMGSRITVVVRKTSTTPQIRRYPFSASTIGFGD